MTMLQLSTTDSLLDRLALYTTEWLELDEGSELSDYVCRKADAIVEELTKRGMW